MNSLQYIDPNQTATITSNGTVCIPKKLRKQMNLKAKDKVYFLLEANGKISMIKIPTTIDDLVGLGEKTFKALGGGEKFLKKERNLWT